MPERTPQRQQCGLATANRAAALWKAKWSTEPTFETYRMGRSMSGIAQAFQENHRREWAHKSQRRRTGLRHPKCSHWQVQSLQDPIVAVNGV